MRSRERTSWLASAYAPRLVQQRGDQPQHVRVGLRRACRARRAPGARARPRPRAAARSPTRNDGVSSSTRQAKSSRAGAGSARASSAISASAARWVELAQPRDRLLRVVAERHGARELGVRRARPRRCGRGLAACARASTRRGPRSPRRSRSGRRASSASKCVERRVLVAARARLHRQREARLGAHVAARIAVEQARRGSRACPCVARVLPRERLQVQRVVGQRVFGQLARERFVLGDRGRRIARCAGARSPRSSAPRPSPRAPCSARATRVQPLGRRLAVLALALLEQRAAGLELGLAAQLRLALRSRAASLSSTACASRVVARRPSALRRARARPRRSAARAPSRSFAGRRASSCRGQLVGLRRRVVLDRARAHAPAQRERLAQRGRVLARRQDLGERQREVRRRRALLRRRRAARAAAARPAPESPARKCASATSTRARERAGPAALSALRERERVARLGAAASARRAAARPSARADDRSGASCEQCASASCVVAVGAREQPQHAAARGAVGRHQRLLADLQRGRGVAWPRARAASAAPGSCRAAARCTGIERRGPLATGAQASRRRCPSRLGSASARAPGASAPVSASSEAARQSPGIKRQTGRTASAADPRSATCARIPSKIGRKPRRQVSLHGLGLPDGATAGALPARAVRALSGALALALREALRVAIEHLLGSHSAAASACLRCASSALSACHARLGQRAPPRAARAPAPRCRSANAARALQLERARHARRGAFAGSAACSAARCVSSAARASSSSRSRARQLRVLALELVLLLLGLALPQRLRPRAADSAATPRSFVRYAASIGVAAPRHSVAHVLPVRRVPLAGQRLAAQRARRTDRRPRRSARSSPASVNVGRLSSTARSAPSRPRSSAAPPRGRRPSARSPRRSTPCG